MTLRPNSAVRPMREGLLGFVSWESDRLTRAATLRHLSGTGSCMEEYIEKHYSRVELRDYEDS